MTKTFKATAEEDARTAKLELPETLADTVSVYIQSRGIPTENKIDPDTGKLRKYIVGHIMGTQEVDGKEQSFTEKYEVECDKQVEIPAYIAEQLRPYIERTF